MLTGSAIYCCGYASRQTRPSQIFRRDQSRKAGLRRRFSPRCASFLRVFAAYLDVQTDKPGNYHLECPSILHRRKPLYFAGIRTNKNYVSFHLLHMYYNPAAVKALSPALRKRMQGKACFNFTAVDEDCFAELGRLIADGLKRYKSKEFQQTIKDMQ